MLEQQTIQEEYGEELYENNVWAYLSFWCENKHLPHFLDALAGWC